MISTPDILSTIQTAIAENAVISGWCLSKYNQPPTVFIGVDVEDPPGKLDPADSMSVDYPAIVVRSVTGSSGNAQNVKSWIVQIDCAIDDDTVTSSTVTIPGETEDDDPIVTAYKKTYDGWLNIEALRELVQDAIRAERFAKITIEAESRTINIYPKFISSFMITIDQVNIRRR